MIIFVFEFKLYYCFKFNPKQVQATLQYRTKYILANYFLTKSTMIRKSFSFAANNLKNPFKIESTLTYSQKSISPLMFQSHSRFYYAEHLVVKEKQKMVGSWLFLTAIGVLGMIALGGYTRLTHSGLSMADWSPHTKTYPKNEEQWNIQFDKYKETIQFKTVNKNIDLNGFKPIYNVEFYHRKVGMYLGYLFCGPLIGLTAAKIIRPQLRNRLFGLLLLGGCQGAIGWWMVKSGLKQKPDYQDRPRVSPYRLATHMVMATLIYSGVLYNSFALLIKPHLVNAADVQQLRYIRKVRIIGIVLIKCIILNILSGALVAGIDAGKVYNTWPLMNGAIIPATALDHSPLWKNFFENKALVQFDHRILAYVTESVACYLLYTIFKHKVPGPVTAAGLIVFSMVNYQALSGILTLLALVPKQKANMHQVTALLTLSSALLMVYLTKSPVAAAAII